MNSLAFSLSLSLSLSVSLSFLVLSVSLSLLPVPLLPLSAVLLRACQSARAHLKWPGAQSN